MVIRQLHYTSLESGTDGRRGFQVSSASAGISRSVEDAAVRASVYRPPAAARAQTEEDVDRLPVSLGYSQADGIAVVYQARYVGEDFAGRQGNYFAHALVAEAQSLGDLLPIETWRAKLWQTSVVSEKELPALAGLESGGVTDSAGVHRFLGGRAHLLPAVISAAQAALVDPRESVVLVCEDADTAAMWIAAVTHALPRHLALAVTFTTYTAAPLDADALLIGTVPGVAIPRDPFRPQTVLDLTGTDLGGSSTRYATLVADAWSTGPQQIDELVGLAERVHPPLSAQELDVLADVDRLLRGERVELGHVAPASAFAQTRLGSALLGDMLTNAARLVPGIGLPDLDLWSDVLTRGERERVPLPAPLVQAYARELLAAVARGEDVRPLQVPTAARSVLHRVAVDWARSAVAADQSPAGVRTVLTSLDVLGVRLPEPELVALADAVLLPALLADSTAATADVVRTDPDSARLRHHLAEAFERVIDGPTATATAPARTVGPTALPVPAAEILHGSTRPGSPASELVAQTLVRSGGLNRLDALFELLADEPRPPAEQVKRLLASFWGEPPTASEGLYLLQHLDGDTVVHAELPDVLVQRLLEDAGRGGLELEHADLAERLMRPPVRGALGSGRPIVEAVQLGAHLRGAAQGRSPVALSTAERAATVAGEVGQDVADWLLRGVVEWLLTVDDPLVHADALGALLQLAPPQLARIYGTKAEATLATADPRLLAAIFPGWLDIALHHPAGRELVGTVLPAVLQRRRRRDLERVGDELHRLAPDLRHLRPALDDRYEGSWELWWNAVRLHHERPTLLGRVFGRRKAEA